MISGRRPSQWEVSREVSQVVSRGHPAAQPGFPGRRACLLQAGLPHRHKASRTKKCSLSPCEICDFRMLACGRACRVHCYAVDSLSAAASGCNTGYRAQWRYCPGPLAAGIAWSLSLWLPHASLLACSPVLPARWIVLERAGSGWSVLFSNSASSAARAAVAAAKGVAAACFDDWACAVSRGVRARSASARPAAPTHVLSCKDAPCDQEQQPQQQELQLVPVQSKSSPHITPTQAPFRPAAET